MTLKENHFKCIIPLLTFSVRGCSDLLPLLYDCKQKPFFYKKALLLAYDSLFTACQLHYTSAITFQLAR